MSVPAYCAVGFLIAFWMGTQDGLERGDWAKGAGMILMCALWPMTVGLGVGMMVLSMWQFAKSLVAKARGQ